MNFSTFNCYEKANETFPKETFERYLESTSFRRNERFLSVMSANRFFVESEFVKTGRHTQKARSDLVPNVCCA